MVLARESPDCRVHDHAGKGRAGRCFPHASTRQRHTASTLASPITGASTLALGHGPTTVLRRRIDRCCRDATNVAHSRRFFVACARARCARRSVASRQRAILHAPLFGWRFAFGLTPLRSEGTGLMVEENTNCRCHRPSGQEDAGNAGQKSKDWSNDPLGASSARPRCKTVR